MKRIIIVALCFLPLLQCSTKKDSQGEKKQAPFDPAVYFVEIERTRKSKPVDIVKIDSIYSHHLAPFVKSVDPASDPIIIDAIKKGKNNDAPHVQYQIVSKTIQKVFYNEIINSLNKLKTLSDEKVYKTEVEKIKNYYAILSPTVIRRSEWIGKKQELEEVCLLQLNELKELYCKPTLEKVTNALENTLKEVYVLSIFYELAGIVENRGKNEKKCEEKLAEGRIFFEIVEKYANDSSLVNSIKTLFETDYNEMDIEKARGMVSKAFNMGIPKFIN